MFYSHEILNDSQYGVATIWLVATVGKGASRKLNRKAIQGVNVPKACETIIEPRAPLALRLQGNLLYGTARVFAQQCGYVLADAEKTQSDMMTFFRVLKTSETDPAAGKTKRKNIILEDDPGFDPHDAIPSLDFLKITDLGLIFQQSQNSGTKYSQLSPYTSSQRSSSTKRAQSILDIGHLASSRSRESIGLMPDFAKESSLDEVHYKHLGSGGEFRPFAEEEADFVGDINLDFDEEGNLIGLMDDEPELPRMPKVPDTRVREGDTIADKAQQEQASALTDDGLLILDEPVLPDAEPFVVRSLEHTVNGTGTVQEVNGDLAKPRARKKRASNRKAKPAHLMDRTDRLSRAEIRAWSNDYVDIMREARRKTKGNLGQARQIAYSFVIGNGVANIGNATAFGGIEHPLAAFFAGPGLQSRLQGVEPVEGDVEEHRGRRRTSSEAFEEPENERRVKPRPEDEDEIGRGAQDNSEEVLGLGDDSMPEVGMDAVATMDERHSSAIMPWSQPGSAVAGSSVRGGPGSAQKGLVPSSPLYGRGNLIPSLERHSDPLVPTSDDLDLIAVPDEHPHSDLLADNDSGVQPSIVLDGEATLDAASQNFLHYMTQQAYDLGEEHGDSGATKYWVDFEQLANPQEHSKSIATQAFLHILSLATKNVVSVHQEVDKGIVPFGKIRVGVSGAMGS